MCGVPYWYCTSLWLSESAGSIFCNRLTTHYLLPPPSVVFLADIVDIMTLSRPLGPYVLIGRSIWKQSRVDIHHAEYTTPGPLQLSFEYQPPYGCHPVWTVSAARSLATLLPSRVMPRQFVSEWRSGHRRAVTIKEAWRGVEPMQRCPLTYHPARYMGESITLFTLYSLNDTLRKG